MTRVARNDKMKHLVEVHKFDEVEIMKMTDDQIEYFHWLYLEDSVNDYM